MKEFITKTQFILFFIMIVTLYSCGSVKVDEFVATKSSKVDSENEKYKVTFKWTGYNKISVFSKNDILDYFKKHPELTFLENDITYVDGKQIEGFYYYKIPIESLKKINNEQNKIAEEKITQLNLPKIKGSFIENEVNTAILDGYYSFNKLYDNLENAWVLNSKDFNEKNLNVFIVKVIKSNKLTSDNLKEELLKYGYKVAIFTFDDYKKYPFNSDFAYFGIFTDKEYERFLIAREKNKQAKETEEKIANELKNGTYTGYVKEYKSDNVTYTGNLINGKYDGLGTLIFYPIKKTKSDRIEGKYIGNFQNGMFNGKGKLTILEYSFRGQTNNIDTNYKEIFEGNFYNGKYEGNGKLYKSSGYSGNTYIGEFKDGMYEGKGKLYSGVNLIEEPNFYGDNRTIEGDWKNDEPYGLIVYKNSQEKIAVLMRFQLLKVII